MKKYSIVLIGILVLSLGLGNIPFILAEETEIRTGQDLPSERSPTAAELAVAILTPSTAPLLVSADKTGVAGQFEVYAASFQGFPIDGPSWALISTGQASGIAGTATTFYSYATYGPSAPRWSNRGYWSYDIATLTLVLSVPPGATTLSFDWKFGTEENPTYTWSYRDTAKAIVTTSVGPTNILLLPNGNPVDVGTASLFSNPVGCSSDLPCSPYPIPNDTIYNAVTGWNPPNPNQIYKATFDLTPFWGETITISFQIGDEGDQILDSALFIDNLNIEYPVGRIFPDKAVGLAKEVIEAPYHQKMYEPSTKGFIWEKSKGYYFFTSEQVKNGYPGKKPGLDCSGLSFWSYNRAYYDDRYETERENFPIYYEGANMQYKGNVEEIKKEELKPGDLLFWNPSGDKKKEMTHVMMYVGPFMYKGKQYNVIHAEGVSIKKITPAIYNPETEEVITSGAKTLKVTAYGRVRDRKLDVLFVAHSPVDLIITDPEGEIITKDMMESLSMAYMVYDIDGDGKVDDIVAIPERKIGNYQITVVPEPDVLPTDTYSLEVTANGQTIVLAEDVLISDIPRTSYIIRSTETEIIPIIPAFVDFDPDTLNLKSNGKWITTYIELPKGYEVKEIDVESIRLNGQILIESKPIEIGDYDGNGIPDLMVKFNRLAVEGILEVGEEIKVTISGKLIDEKPFEGSDVIRVINQGKK